MLQALFAQIVLVDLIERQADEVFAVGAQRFGAGELEALSWPEADELHAQRRDVIVQHAQRVKEPLTVTELIAHAVHGDDLAFQIQLWQLRPDRFPVFLQFAEIPGRDAEDQNGIVLHQLGRDVFQVVQVDQVFTQNLTDFFCRHLGVAGAGAVKQTNLHV